MNIRLSAVALGLLAALVLLAPVHAAPREDPASGDPHFPIGQVIGHLDEAIDEIEANDPKQAGMLLPAIQKVREAAARISDGCAVGRKKGIIAFVDCGWSELKVITLTDESGDEMTPTLMQLACKGTHIRTVPKTRKWINGLDNDPDNFDVLLDAILIGLNDWLKEHGATEATREHILLARQVGAVGPESP